MVAKGCDIVSYGNRPFKYKIAFMKRVVPNRESPLVKESTAIEDPWKHKQIPDIQIKSKSSATCTENKI